MKKTKAVKGPEGKDEDLGQILYSIILQAIKDTTLWLSTKASAEEKVYIRRAQARLNELARICERNRDLIAPPQKDKEWNHVATELLSLVQKAETIRQSMVGHGLPRLMELLTPPAKSEMQLQNEAKNRSDRIHAFIETVLQETNQKITKNDISIVARYKDRTTFQRFQRNDPRTTSTAKGAFERVLSMEPIKFICRLEDVKKHQD